MNKKAQVWIETVIYTLIGLSLIAIVLAVVTPKINEYKDRAVIEQTIASMSLMDKAIEDTLSGAVGNARKVDFRMKKGNINFDQEEDKIYFVLNNSDVIYSQPDEEVELTKFIILTQNGTRKHSVTLTLDYSEEFDLQFEDGLPETLKYTQSTVPYKFRFEKGELNEGDPKRQIIKFAKI